MTVRIATYIHPVLTRAQLRSPGVAGKYSQAAGLWSELESHASAIKKIHVSDRGHMGLTRISAEEAGVEALGYVIENRWIGAVLLGRLAATSVEMMAPERVAKIDAAQVWRGSNSGEQRRDHSNLTTGDRRRGQFSNRPTARYSQRSAALWAAGHYCQYRTARCA